jgi:hypothetical protein
MIMKQMATVLTSWKPIHRKLVGSQTGSYYSEHGRAVYMGKGPAKLRSQQRKLHPDKQDWTMKQTSLLGIAKYVRSE